MHITNPFTLIDRLLGEHPHGSADGPSGAVPRGAVPRSAASIDRLSADELEEAYRTLLLENQVLAESNERLVERLARRQHGVEDARTTQELLRTQRNALVERSHRLREVEYENKQLRRQQKKLAEENNRLKLDLERQRGEARALAQREQACRQELAQVQAALREKAGELAMLRERQHRLESRLHLQQAPSSAANGDF